MAEIFAIHKKRKFTLQEARKLLPIVIRLTEQAEREVSRLNTQYQISEAGNKQGFADQIQKVFQEWYQKVHGLGAEVKGMWLVDFDEGEGYYCWHFPETELCHYHGYKDGFEGRTKIH